MFRLSLLGLALLTAVSCSHAPMKGAGERNLAQAGFFCPTANDAQVSIDDVYKAMPEGSEWHWSAGAVFKIPEPAKIDNFNYKNPRTLDANKNAGTVANPNFDKGAFLITGSNHPSVGCYRQVHVTNQVPGQINSFSGRVYVEVCYKDIDFKEDPNMVVYASEGKGRQRTSQPLLEMHFTRPNGPSSCAMYFTVAPLDHKEGRDYGVAPAYTFTRLK